MAYQSQLETIQVTIPSGQSLSGAAALEGKALVAVITPAAWTAAALTFLKSADGGSFYPVFDQGAEVSVSSGLIPTAEARWFDLDPAGWLNASHLKVRSGTNAAAVNQGADRALTLVVRPI